MMTPEEFSAQLCDVEIDQVVELIHQRDEQIRVEAWNLAIEASVSICRARGYSSDALVLGESIKQLLKPTAPEDGK